MTPGKLTAAAVAFAVATLAWESVAEILFGVGLTLAIVAALMSGARR